MDMIKGTFIYVLILLVTGLSGYGQNIPQATVVYPNFNSKVWHGSYGVTFMTTPRVVTEEFHRRIPAGEITAIKYLSERFYLNPKLRFQFIQNELILNSGYLLDSNEKYGLAFELAGSIWAGILRSENFDRKGYGFMCYPALKGGMIVKKDLYLTLKAELILNLARRDIAGEISQSLPSPLYSGQALSFYVEQPFVKSTSIILGFRAMYCDFYWQTWTLNETFEEHIFYPEIMVQLII
jgi:hypothetical protein